MLLGGKENCDAAGAAAEFLSPVGPGPHLRGGHILSLGQWRAALIPDAGIIHFQPRYFLCNAFTSSQSLKSSKELDSIAAKRLGAPYSGGDKRNTRDEYRFSLLCRYHGHHHKSSLV